ncbi:MAG: substrate-binding domain-containing protein [Spirochaetes bacterium]|nr:substrate-binding domain-containing protein [Spirochaetota bacterium]
MKKIALLLVVLMAVTSAAFAGGRRADDQLRIGLLMRNTNEQFLMDYATNVQALAGARGVAVNLQDALGDSGTQMDQLIMLLNQGYRYFVIIPTVPALADAMNQEIQMRGGAAAFSNTAPTTSSLRIGPHFFFASSPEFVGGQIQADLIANFFERHPERAPGQVVNMLLINGQIGHPAQVHRRAGLLAGLAARGFTLNIVAEGTANWAPDEANELMNAWIAAFSGQFNVVAAQNDGMALGAVQSMMMNGLVTADNSSGTFLTVPVLGIDATADALASMGRYELYATVLQDAIGQSTTAFDLMYQMATGAFSPGNAAGGITPATAAIDEEPANDPAILSQIYLVPFAPVDRASPIFLNF